MSDPVFNIIAHHPLLKGSALEAAFKATPLGFIDVGARRGAPPLAAPVAKLASFTGFEPDRTESDRMNADAGFKAPWARCTTLPVALGRTAEERDLYITALATNISLYKPNPLFAARYRPKGTDVTRVERIAVRPLDDVIAEKGDAQAGEFIKVDTQGSELEILAGAQSLLRTRTLCVVAEVEFCEFYEGQPLFADIARFMSEQGFAFYGFQTLHHRSQKRLDKTRAAGRERLWWADAVFFKDPFDKGGDPAVLEGRSGLALFLIAATLEYYDFALEISAAIGGPEALQRKALVDALAAVDDQATGAAVRDLMAKVERRPDQANLLAARFVDARRHMNDVQDVPSAVDGA